MANWIRLGTVSEVPVGRGKAFEAAGTRIAVFDVGGELHAIDDTCMHRGGPLSEGDIQGNIVTCPWHFWSYDVTTGKTTMSEEMGVKKYALELRGDEIYVEVS